MREIKLREIKALARDDRQQWVGSLRDCESKKGVYFFKPNQNDVAECKM
jgi:hypothetical protein